MVFVSLVFFTLGVWGIVNFVLSSGSKLTFAVCILSAVLGASGLLNALLYEFRIHEDLMGRRGWAIVRYTEKSLRCEEVRQVEAESGDLTLVGDRKRLTLHPDTEDHSELLSRILLGLKRHRIAPFKKRERLGEEPWEAVFTT
ncbi:MAG: hypothetical protein RBT76_06130 [candidate division Zixibacteria bacterium]|nr:hypothetical protein [candidate division Zixibacteria bacterium]